MLRNVNGRESFRSYGALFFGLASLSINIRSYGANTFGCGSAALCNLRNLKNHSCLLLTGVYEKLITTLTWIIWPATTFTAHAVLGEQVPFTGMGRSTNVNID